MKIEIDIKTDDIVDQVARHMMGYVAQENGDVSFDPEEGPEYETTAPKWKGKTVAEMVRDIVAERTRRAVDDEVKRVAGEAIRAAVAQVLADGWQATNNYGEPTGPRLDLKARVGEMLLKLQGNQYDSNRKVWVDAVIEEHLRKVLQDHFAKELDAAKAKFRSLLDGTISAKLNETLKSALGLR